MEDTLRDGSMLRHNKLQDVLILVLMEDTLRDSERRGNETVTVCLNPCFNGRYSQSKHMKVFVLIREVGLNPCFNGRYSQRPSLLF